MAQTSSTNEVERPRNPHQTRNRWLKAIAIAAAVLFIALAVVLDYAAHHAGPLLRRAVIASLASRFHSPVQLDALDVSLAHGLEVQGHGLRILYLAGPKQPDLPHAPGYTVPPMLSVDNFSFRTTLRSLLHLRADIARVDIDGMNLHIPPRSGGHIDIKPPRTRFKLTVAKIFCKNVNLFIENDKPGKFPLQFNIRNLELSDIGPGQPLLYVADVVNPKPIGVVHAHGHFGPWQGDDPRSTPLDGQYTFTHADLGSLKGIGGILSSAGHFSGALDHIAIDGTTTTPNFFLDISNHPVPLETRFHAFVNGANGDTTLDPVYATLLHSSFTTSGVVTNIHGQGHDIALTVDMPNGRIQDLLQLGMKVDPPVMSGAVTMQAKLHIPPGDVRVADKLQLTGRLRIQGVEFSDAKLQDRIDGLSMRAQGKPKDIHVAETDHRPEVASRMGIDFSLAGGIMTFSSIDYKIPGAQVLLDGVESLDGNVYDFKGHFRAEATASHMVTGWKSVLLTPFDPLFKKHGAGLDLPIAVSGSGRDIHFGLDMHGTNESTRQMKADLKILHPTPPAKPH